MTRTASVASSCAARWGCRRRRTPQPSCSETVARWTAPGLGRQLRIARLIRVSVEGNAGLCRSLLKTRYDLAEVAA